MNWYAKTINENGLVTDENGDYIAVTYKSEHAALVAAVPELLEALKAIEGMCNMPEVKQAMMKHEQAFYYKTMNNVRRAIQKAESRE